MESVAHDLIYLDHAATTPLDGRVLDAMMPYLTSQFGNPSSIYGLGRSARAAIDTARDTVAALVGARPTEIIFTSGGTESDNAAILGAALARQHDGKHIITAATEHHAVLHSCDRLAEWGFEITVLPVDSLGHIDLAELERTIRPDTTLLTMMYANNEIGTIHPLAEIARIAHARGVAVHSDAVQAGGALPIDVDTLGVDLLSLSGHKFYGPKGVGLLYVRRGVPWLPQQLGGGQERGRRSGTENTAGIVGFATALSLAVGLMAETTERLLTMREQLRAGLFACIEDIALNGDPLHRLPNNLNISLGGVDAESLLLNLDMHGVAASSGSACTAGSLDPSHVLTALGMEKETAAASLRLSLGRSTTQAQIERVLELLPPIVTKLRNLATV